MHIICRHLSSQVNHSPKKLKYEKLTVLKVKEKENVQSKKGQVIQTEKKTTVSKGTFFIRNNTQHCSSKLSFFPAGILSL